MLNLKQILTFGALFAGAHALPEPTNALKPRAVDCKAVNKALSCLKTLGAPATAFCSSYLHIPATTTITSTAVANTVTVTTTTVTIATTSPVCPAAKRYLVPRHFMAAERRGFAVAAEPAPQVYKRNNIPQLSSFAAAQLSSGCSCLGLAPKTATTTFTPPPSTVGTYAVTTSCSVCLTSGAPIPSLGACNRCCEESCEFDNGENNPGFCINSSDGF